MREIKFRQPSMVGGKFDSWHYWGWQGDSFIGPMTGRHKTESMQFTGLLDKNGKEIYEGDFVKTYDDEGNIENNGYASLVLFKNCCFHLYDDYEILRDKSAGWGSVEVIGNRFENPDLIP